MERVEVFSIYERDKRSMKKEENNNWPMDPDIKERWIKALRSGKYEQDQGFLRTPDGYCCLGVLSDLYAKDNDLKWLRANWVYRLEGSDNDTWLTSHIVAWAKLNSKILVEKATGYEIIVDQYDLAKMNDDDVSFSEIADVIEEFL
jgi:hypothetical protein